MKSNDINLFHRSIGAMNSQLDIIFWGSKTSNYETAFQTISEQTTHYEMVLSRYNTQSELYRLNQNAYKQSIDVSNLLWTAINRAATYYEISVEYFDITQGRLYHKIKQGNENEDAEDRIKHGWQLELNSTEKSVRFTNPDVLLDFGGMGKGFLLESIDNILEKFQIQNAFISFGGSSVLTRGKHPHGPFWPFSLHGKQASLKIWELNKHSISVSSTRTNNNNKNKHIVNPHTGKSIEEEITVVVKASNPVDAEVLSTSLLAAPKNTHQILLNNFEENEVDIFENQ